MRELCRTFLHRLAALFRHRHLEDDLDAELRSHIEMAIELNMRKGMSAEDARREALRSFGGVEQTKEIYRDQRGLPLLETTLQDLRFGLRMLRRSPGFSILAILCLTLGIGANAAVFSWIEGILFRPYPLVAHQEQLLAITGTARGEAGHTDLSWPDILDLQKSCTLIDSFIVTKIMGTTLSLGDRAERTIGSVVSANYFDAIGVHPILRARVRARRRRGKQCPSRDRDQLSAIARPLQRRSRDYWEDAAPERRRAHDCWCRARGISRDLRRLGHAVL